MGRRGQQCENRASRAGSRKIGGKYLKKRTFLYRSGSLRAWPQRGAGRAPAIPAGRIKRSLTMPGRFCRAGYGKRGASPALRIEGTSRTGVSGYAAPLRRAGGESFAPEAEASAARPANTAPVLPTTGLEALLALQAVEDVALKRRKAVRRGRQLLDTLDEVKADLLAGRVSEGRLNQLLALLGQARDRTEAGLDGVLDEVELRARVELAKFGRFAGG